jgi:hypothetical protein
MTRMTRSYFFRLLPLCLSSFWAPAFCQNNPAYPVVKKAQTQQIQAYQQVQFSGRVFDRSTQQPLAGVAVQVTDVDSSFRSTKAVTNADGTYNFQPGAIRNFRIEVSAPNNNAAYERYVSGVYNTVSLMRSKQFELPAVYLSAKPKTPDQPSGNPPSGNNPSRPPSQRDTMPTPKEVYLGQKLFNEHGVLPTPSAIALYYALNPGLKDLANIPPGYTLVQPPAPPFTSGLKRQFSSRFKQDSEKDPASQRTLNDSTTAYVDFYRNVFRNTSIRYVNVNADSLRTVCRTIVNDAEAYKGRISSTRKAKADRLTNVMISCSEILRNAVAKGEITRTDYEELVALGSYLSTLSESSSFLDLFRQLLREQLGTGHSRTPVEWRRGAFQYAGFHQSKRAGVALADSLAEILSNDGRAFNVSVYVREPDGSTSHSQSESEGRYLVSFYPPALRAIKRMYIDCNPLATFGRVTLHEGRYEQKVLDTFTNQELEIISSGGKTFDTRPAFGKPAKPLLGDVNFTEIKIYAKR